MMQDSTPVLLAACMAAVLCCVVLFVILLAILRVTGRNFFSFFSLLVNSTLGREKDDAPLRLPRRRVDLRAKAQEADFDAALAAQATKAQTGLPPAPPVTPSVFDDPAMPRPQTPERRRREGYDNDEIFGGLLDDDGDGNPDY